MDLSEYIREILKKIPEKINIKSPDPGRLYGLWHPFSWTGEKGIRLFPKECCSGKTLKKTGSAPGEAGEALPVISIRTVPAAT